MSGGKGLVVFYVGSASMEDHASAVRSQRVWDPNIAHVQTQTYLSISFSISTLNCSSHPTSMRICIPPSNSRRDCDAGEELCAPRRGVKLNILAVANSGVGDSWPQRA